MQLNPSKLINKPGWFRAKFSLGLVATVACFMWADIAAGDDPTVAISCGVTIVYSPDTDNDELTDALEEWLGTSHTDPDSDNDNMPDGWEYHNGLDPTRADGSIDSDSDGVDNFSEYIADTDPQDDTSLLLITDIQIVNTNTACIYWQGGEAVTQFVQRTESLSDTNAAWLAIFTNIPPTATATNIIDGAATNQTQFYRIKAIR